MNHNRNAFIVIGAAGFLGSSFSTYLKSLNSRVFNIVRGSLAEQASADHFTEELLNSGYESFTIIDFAYTSVPNSSFINPVKDFSENLYNVIRHLEFARKLSHVKYVYISSGGTVYGNTSYNEPIDEDQPNLPISPYGITKLSCEKYVLMYKALYGLDIRIVRPSNIYGPGQKPFRGQGLIATAIANALRFQPIQIYGDGSLVRDYLYIDDFCKMLDDIIQSDNKDIIYNAGSGIGYSINEILDTIKGHIEGPVKIDRLPSRPFDVVYNVLNSSKAIKLNQRSPVTSLQDGIAYSVQWAKAREVNHE